MGTIDDQRRILTIPCHHPELEAIVFGNMKYHGLIDPSDTFAWVLRLRSESELYDAICQAWASTNLPLRGMVRCIDRVGVVCEPEHLRCGIWIKLKEGDGGGIVQQAPLDRDCCARALKRLVHPLDELLVDIFSAAPGLTWDTGGMLVPPLALESPMDVLARAHYGECVRDLLRSDVYVFTPGEAAIEFACFNYPHRLPRDWLVVAKDGSVFAYMDDVTPDLTEVSSNLSTIITNALLKPSELYSHVRDHLVMIGRHIPWYRPGENARARYEALSDPDKVVIALSVAITMFDGHDDNVHWSRWHRILRSIRNAIASNIMIESDVMSAVLHETTENRLNELSGAHHWIEDVGIYTLYIRQIATAWNTKGTNLRYPDLRIRTGARCSTVYATVERYINRLESARHMVSMKTARSELLREWAQF